jgi:CelD/BcsL family acetyltransferase involved in cellulose biosynthesis
MSLQPGQLVIKEIHSLMQLEDLYEGWVKLQNLSQLEHPFLDWNWITGWWDRMIFEKKYPVILVGYDNADCICGFAPFQFNKAGLLKTLEGFAQEFCDYIDWLCLPGMENEFGEAVIVWLKSARNQCDYIRIFNIPISGIAYTALSKFGDKFISKHSIAPYISLEKTYIDYLQSLKKKFISDTGRRQKKLEKEKGDMQYFVIANSDEIKKMVGVIAKWMNARIGKKKASSYLEREKMQEHMVRLYKKMFDLDMLHLSGLEINKQIAALNVAFKYKNALFSYTPVFDPDFSQYSVIRFLKMKNIEECYIKGWKKYDFCLGGESYKFNFNPQTKQLFSFSMYGPTLKGLLRKYYDKRIKPRLRKNESK